MRKAIIAAALALSAGTIPALADGFRVECSDLDTQRSPNTGAAARLIVKNDRASDVELRVVRHNGSEISLGPVKAKSSREITTRMRYLFVIYEGSSHCVMGVRMTDSPINIVVK